MINILRNPFDVVKACLDDLVGSIKDSLGELREDYNYAKISYLIPGAIQELEKRRCELNYEIRRIESFGSYLEKIALERGLDGSFMFSPRDEEGQKAYETGLGAWLFVNELTGVRARDMNDPNTLKGFRYGLYCEGRRLLYERLLNPLNQQQAEALVMAALKRYGGLIKFDTSFRERMKRFRGGLELAYCSVHGWERATKQLAKERFRLE